jgi:hypothetical protein
VLKTVKDKNYLFAILILTYAKAFYNKSLFEKVFQALKTSIMICSDYIYTIFTK